MSLIDIVVEPYGSLWRVMEKRGPSFSYVLASHNDEESAESHARRIRAALDWRPGDGDPWAAHVAAQDERIARLEAELREVRERAVTLGEPLRFSSRATATELDEAEREQEALEQRVAALVVDPPHKRPRRPWVSRHAALASELTKTEDE